MYKCAQASGGVYTVHTGCRKGARGLLPGNAGAIVAYISTVDLCLHYRLVSNL